MIGHTFNFLKYRVPAAFFSLAFIGAGVAGYMYHGGFRYSVDFTGGTQVMFKFSKPVGSEALKAALSKSGWEDAVTREFGNDVVVVRVKQTADDAAGLATKIKMALESSFDDTTATISEVNAVGPGTGAELSKNFILMISFGLLLMFLYIAFRFWSFSYGLGALVALLHDPLAILSVIAMLNTEISPTVICAMIAALGYSINDTIVIFARIRECFSTAKPGDSPVHIVNDSLNQTLSRTILTSFATLLVVASLFFFGGESLKNFALALMVGIVMGTYSSIFVASPIMLLFRR